MTHAFTPSAFARLTRTTLAGAALLFCGLASLGCERGGQSNTTPTTQAASSSTTHAPAAAESATGQEHAMSSDVFGSFPHPKEDLKQPDVKTAKIILAGGCFWCTEAVFEQLAGVSDVMSGYAGGNKASANYHAVSGGGTDHAEVIQITYDPSVITYGQLLRVFFATHDPTQLNRQGNDVGRQYRSAIFFANDDEKRVAQAYIEQLNDTPKLFGKPIVTTLEPLTEFYPAEGYHQDYARNNPLQPYIQFHAIPNAKKVDQLFPDLKK